MAEFRYFLNRQGVRGAKGDKGEKGFSPVITEKENTKESYVLHIQNETDDTSFDTPNLKEGLVPEDLGGTYVKLNRDTGKQYYGNIDEGTNTIKGIVRFATDVEASNGEEVTAAVTPDQVAVSYTTKATTNKLSADLTALTTQEQNDVIALGKRITTNETNISSMRADINSIASDSASLKNSNRFTGTNTFTGKVNIAGAPLEVDGVATLNQVTAKYLNAINITTSGEINAVSIKANGLRSDDIQTTENKKYLTEADVDNQTIQVVNGKLHANLDELGNEVNDLSGRVTTNEADISTMKTSLGMKQTKLTPGTNITLTDLSDGTVKIDAAGGGGSGATIDDSTAATTSVWSSSKTNTEITTAVDTINSTKNDNIFDISKFKVVGSPTITDDGIASGFSRSNFLTLNSSALVSATNYSINCAFCLLKDLTTNEYNFVLADDQGSNYGITICIYPSKIYARCNSTSNMVLLADNILLNTMYHVQIDVIDGNCNITTTVNNIKTTKTLDISTIKPWSNTLWLGNRPIDNIYSAFLGSIDLKSFSITVDGKEVFSSLMSSTKPIYDAIKVSNTELSEFKTETSTDFSAVNSALNEKANLTDLALKQNTLVSGTNIKTINGETILGEGDITVGGSTPTVIDGGNSLAN